MNIDFSCILVNRSFSVSRIVLFVLIDFCGWYVNTYEGFMLSQSDVVFNLLEKEGIPATWILLDSQSTVDLFCDKNCKVSTNTAL